MKKTFSLKVKFNEQDAKKLALVAKGENMSVEKLLIFLARQKMKRRMKKWLLVRK